MINGERVKQAREFKKLTQAELAKRLDIRQSAIAQIENGNTQPSEEVLQGIVLQTGFPLGFFRQPTSTDFPLGSLMFRARASMTYKDKCEAHQYGRTIFELHEALEQYVNKIPLTLPRVSEEPAKAAKLTRSAFGLSPETPISNLIHAAEKAGVTVLALPKALNKRDAYAVWVSRESLRPVIIVSACNNGDRLRFSVAHELGHLVLHHSVRVDMPTLEAEADLFASELLMPEEAMRRELTTPVTLAGLAALKARWKVSIQALVRRALQLNIITARQYKYLMEQVGHRGWRTQEPVAIQAERPRALRKMAELVYGLPLNYRRIASACNLPIPLVRDTLEVYAGKVGATPKPAEKHVSEVRELTDFTRRKSS